jgi:hypothetical protein
MQSRPTRITMYLPDRPYLGWTIPSSFQRHDRCPCRAIGRTRLSTRQFSIAYQDGLSLPVTPVTFGKIDPVRLAHVIFASPS